MERTSRKKLALVEERDADTKKKNLHPQHAGLWLDKYIYNPQQNALDEHTQQSVRKQLLEEVCAIGISDDYKNFYARWVQHLDAFGAKSQHATATGRISLGLGTESVLETGITLHHTYGVPYLPGSALKGLAASYAHQQLEDERWKKGKEWHTIVFGTTEEAGFITFFDALLDPEKTTSPFLHQDIITVHHPDYYQTGKKPPADWDNPTPISFLSANGTYLLALAATDLEEKEVWLQATWEILKLALADVGIGAKTSSGYGRMIIVDRNASVTEIAVRVTEPEPDQEMINLQQTLEAIKRLTPGTLPGASGKYYSQWQRLQSTRARVMLAETFLAQISQFRQEKNFSEKAWYRDIKTFLDRQTSEEI